jgi:hypothetical protein
MLWHCTDKNIPRPNMQSALWYLDVVVVVDAFVDVIFVDVLLLKRPVSLSLSLSIIS